MEIVNNNTRFCIDRDILYRVDNDKGLDRITPIISKDAFIACYKAWIKKDGEEDDGK